MGYMEQKTKMDRLLLPHNIRKCINLVVDFHWLEKCDVGKTSFPPSSIEINDDSNKKGKKPASNYHKTSFWDYENEKMNDYDNWSDPFGDERAFYDGWSREDVESGLADAYE